MHTYTLVFSSLSYGLIFGLYMFVYSGFVPFALVTVVTLTFAPSRRSHIFHLLFIKIHFSFFSYCLKGFYGFEHDEPDADW
jgi:hypothetical protein